jgi:Domain of unknown function (DUF1905)/Bacteriocin-protection, YdeI or OmpD-Associated
MTSVHFKAVIEIRDGNPYVLVSAEQAGKLKPNWKRPLPVIAQINDKPDEPWHINMMPAGDGSFYLYLDGDVRKASDTKVGDKVTVDVAFDPEYKGGPMHPMPKWFKDALAKNAVAKKNWEALIPSRQKEILRYFSWLKTQEAIDRNLEQAMYVLSGKPARFMARSWKDGE